MKLLNIYKKDLFDSKRNFGLDLIRSFAIMLVLFSHLGIKEKDTFGINIGGLGVEIFFVLSGFLIGQILIKNFSKDLSASSVLNFWVRRWFRTLPLYYLMILTKFILVDHSLGFKILVYFVFLQNNFVGIDFMPVTWSLVIEEWFYLSLPVFLFVFFYKKKITPKNLSIFILCFIVLINIIRFVFVWKTNRGYGAITGNFPFRLDSMMCGVLLANLKLNFKKTYESLTTMKIFILAIVFYGCFLYWIGRIVLQNGSLDQSLFSKTIWFGLNSLCIALLIPFIESKIKISSPLNYFKLLISSTSIFSYCMYLIHMEIFSRIIEVEPFSFTWLVQSTTCIILTYLISGLVYGIYEKPITNLREKFSNN